MLLRVKERLFLLDILPQVGDYITLKVVRSQRESFSFSEDEHKALGFHREGNGVSWDEKVDSPVDILIGETATNIIVEALKDLDSKKQLKEEFLPLYEHFVEGEDWSPTLDVVKATSEDGDKPTPIKEPEPRTTKEALGSSPAAEGSKD